MKKTTGSTKAKATKAQGTVFKIHSPKAKKVSLAGDFNNWDTCALSGKKDTKGNWSIKVALKPGRYEYKFFVDGSWMTDPATPVVTNIYGSQNSVIEVK